MDSTPFDGLVCPFCEHTDVRPLAVRSAVRINGAYAPIYLANCAGCGLVFRPPPEVEAAMAAFMRPKLECMFCGKRATSRQAKANHERFCPKNPNGRKNRVLRGRQTRTAKVNPKGGAPENARYVCESCNWIAVRAYAGETIECPRCGCLNAFAATVFNGNGRRVDPGPRDAGALTSDG